MWLVPSLALCALLPAFGACLIDFEEFDFGFVSTASTGLGPTGTGGAGVGGFTTSSSAGGAGGAGPTTVGSTAVTTGSGGAGGNPPGVTVTCGAMTCNVSGGEICCVPQGMVASSMCFMGMTCPGMNVGEVSCDEPGDCPGQVCCGNFTGGGYSQVSCQNSCNGGGNVIICNTTADCTGNDTCQTSSFLPMGYMVCRP